MVDQRGRDNPPTFSIDPQFAAFKYHALLTDPIIDTWKDEQQRDTSLVRDRGLYGFTTIEARDRFCSRCNGLSEIEEYPVCYPVTVPAAAILEPMVKRIRVQK